MGNRILVARQWRFPKVVLSFFAVELCLTVAALALFGIADPNLYRTKLWLDGALNGFNSHPEQVLYAYANHEKPVIPLVWSQTITTFNLVTSILSTFLLLVKSVMFVMKTWVPLLSLLMHMALTALYTFSTYAQLSSDKSDPFGRIQNGPPWYITKSCDVIHNRENHGYCRQAKASLGVTVAMTGILFIQIILACISVVPSTLEKQLRGQYDEDSDDEYQYGEVVMYAPEKPAENPFYSPQTPSQAHPYSPLPQKQPIHYQQDTEYELANLTTKADLEAQRQSQQYPQTFTPQPPQSYSPRPFTSHTPRPPSQAHDSNPPSRPTSHAPGTFTQNLMTQYLQHSPARAITTSEPTPPFSREEPNPAATSQVTEIPLFDPPPLAAAAPTPRTVAFNRLVGRGATNAEKIKSQKKETGRSKLGMFTRNASDTAPGKAAKEKETRKERKEREAAEKETERKRQVERYFELQRAGPPGRWERLQSPAAAVPGTEGERGYFVGEERGVAVSAQEYIQGYQARGHGQTGGLPFRERYGG